MERRRARRFARPREATLSLRRRERPRAARAARGRRHTCRCYGRPITRSPEPGPPSRLPGGRVGRELEGEAPSRRRETRAVSPDDCEDGWTAAEFVTAVDRHERERDPA